MKLMIDITEVEFNACKRVVEAGVADWQDKVIASGTPLPTGEWEKVTEAHEDIGYDRGFRDGYAQAVEERTCEWENDEEGRNHEQRY